MDHTEVLNDLRQLSEKGYIKAVSKGSNAIGKTLRAYLDKISPVSINNLYKGFRITGTTFGESNRTNIFSKVPNWSQSLIKSPTELVNNYGLPDVSGKYKRSLFCTVDTRGPNPNGLYLKLSTSERILSEWFDDGKSRIQLVVWDSSKLESKLMERNNTITITANVQKRSDGKYFHFRQCEVMQGPKFDQFLNLLDVGAITMDHLISLNHDHLRAREQGPTFKCNADTRVSLYTSIKKFDLLF